MTQPRSLSVVLVTSDDADRLPRLLASLAGSDVPPSELVVQDDGSRDGTVALIEVFAERVGFAVRIHVNDRPRGPAETYGAALMACESELIAIAEAGDRWMPSKIGIALEAFGTHADIGMHFGDGILTGGAAGQQTLFGTVGLAGDRVKAVRDGELLPLLVPYPLVAAGTVAFLADLRDVLLPVPHITTIDHWIPLVAGLARPYVMSEDVLIERASTVPTGTPAAVLPDETGLARWRTRLRSASSKANPKLADANRFVRQTQAMLYDEVLRRHGSEVVTYQQRHRIEPPRLAESTVHDLRERADHLRVRGSMPDRRLRRIRPIVRELRCGRYDRYSAGPLSALQDLLA